MKARIAKACVQLLREHNLDEITVRDVAELCGISRQAFYYYFENIEAVVMYSVEGGLEALQEKCMQIEDPKEVLRVIIRSYADQYDLLKHLIQSKNHLRIKRYYHNILYNSVMVQLKRYSNRDDLDPGELEMYAAFIAYGLGGLLYDRCGDKDLDLEKFAEEVYRIIGRGIIKNLIKKGE